MHRLYGTLMLLLTSTGLTPSMPSDDARTATAPTEPLVSRRLVFVGDSLTHGGDWGALLEVDGVVNFGIPGDTTADILDRLDQILSVPATHYFLMAGINDLLRGVRVEEIVQNHDAILARMRAAQPLAVFYLQSVLPVNSQLGYFLFDNSVVRALNAELAKLENTAARIHFVDLAAALSDERGQLPAAYSTDGLHLSSAGYRRWSEALRNTLAEER